MLAMRDISGGDDRQQQHGLREQSLLATQYRGNIKFWLDMLHTSRFGCYLQDLESTEGCMAVHRPCHDQPVLYSILQVLFDNQ